MGRVEPRARPLRAPPIGFAHRGARAEVRENTLAAFSRALELGATGLESDVWITADGVAVLDHDGVVQEGAERRPLREIHRGNLPPHIPSLRELYETCGTDHELSLDVKDEGAAPEVIALARAAGASGRLWLCHWNWRVVARWRELSDDVRLVDSTGTRHMRTEPRRRAARMADLGIDAINLHHTDWVPELVAEFHRSERLVFGWDAQSEPALRAVIELGVDGVYSDHVPRMMDVIRRVG